MSCVWPIARPFVVGDLRADQPGRKPVKVGDSREYSVQQTGEEGDLFVRIPLNSLGVERGQKILASFNENGISIARIG